MQTLRPNIDDVCQRFFRYTVSHDKVKKNAISFHYIIICDMLNVFLTVIPNMMLSQTFLSTRKINKGLRYIYVKQIFSSHL